MLNVSRLICSRLIPANTRTILVNPPRKYNILRNYSQSLLWRQNTVKKLNLQSFIRSSVTTAVRLSSDTSAKSQKKVGYWLLSCGGMVFVAVVLGGVTRLTESGLSMVTWRLLGERMPRTQQEWQREFEKYQQYPEFQIKNRGMTLSEFKWIWYMEFAHRMWGRAIGGVFLLPAAYFWARGQLRPGMKPRVLAMGALIAFQGLLGWYMVKSGLEDRFHGESDVPRVSQYRLAAHLGTAFVLYSLLLWNALDHLLPAQALPAVGEAARRAARSVRTLAHSCKALVFLTALSGAFVAGLDAGLVYNSFPKMADRWVPEDALALSPPLRNLTENPSTVQFQHRVLGSLALALGSGLWLVSRRRALPPRAHSAAAALALLLWAQATLGVSTLLTYVPVPLAASHQAGSLTVLSAAVWLTHELRRLPK